MSQYAHTLNDDENAVVGMKGFAQHSRRTELRDEGGKHGVILLAITHIDRVASCVACTLVVTTTKDMRMLVVTAFACIHLRSIINSGEKIGIGQSRAIICTMVYKRQESGDKKDMRHVRYAMPTYVHPNRS
jgi:hypothetical protein